MGNRNRYAVCGAVCTVVVVAVALTAPCIWFLFRWRGYRLEENAIQELLASGTDVDRVRTSTFLGVPLFDREVSLTFHGQVGAVPLRDIRNLGGIQFEDCIVRAEMFRQLRRPERLTSADVANPPYMWELDKGERSSMAGRLAASRNP